MSTSLSTRNLVYTGKREQITSFRVPDFQYSTLGKLLLYRLMNNRDCKVIITSRGSTTGTGKTTLAIHLCRWIRRCANELFGRSGEWSAKEHSFVGTKPYLEAYQDAEPGDALLLDEIEFSADRRRHMTHENVNLSHAWSILRYRNVVSIATLPTASMLDQRMMELADVWINVIMRGRANTYYLTVNDFTHDLVYKRLKQAGYNESVIWPDLPSGDEDFEYLADEKVALGIPGMGGEEEVTEQDLEEQDRETRRDVALRLLKLKRDGEIHLTQAEIGDIVGYSQQWVGALKREELA